MDSPKEPEKHDLDKPIWGVMTYHGYVPNLTYAQAEDVVKLHGEGVITTNDAINRAEMKAENG